MRDVIGSKLHLARRFVRSPVIPRYKSQIRLTAMPAGDCFGIIAQRHRLACSHVERFANRCRGIFDSELERLSYVIDVDMLKCREAVIWKIHDLAGSEAIEHFTGKMAGGIDRIPTRTGDVSRVKHGCRKSLSGFIK